MGKHSHRRRAGRAGAQPSSFVHSEEEARSAGHRHARLERVIREELVGLLRDELRDPALDGVLFASVELSADYRNARVRFVLEAPPEDLALRDARLRAAEKALERAVSYLRARLLDALEIKRVPNLRFVADREGTSLVDEVRTLGGDPEDLEEPSCRE